MLSHTAQRDEFVRNAVELPPSYFSSHFSSVLKIAVSSDEQSVALFLDTDVLWVGSLDFSEVKFELPLRGRVSAVGSEDKTPVPGSHPLALKWLDNSTVAVQWTNFIALVDVEKNVYEFFYPTCIHTEVEVRPAPFPPPLLKSRIFT
ncbi:unnamed protein product [Dibothriocephalus latus]|uniref:Vps16 N-terminal domain-containing protein n=1 Tax=Dibothriocephalus latus TaxID=60516 RepID=A0A3P7P242_DIBLA|nr:unnamed protein product [Dibothriocephalus latus]